MMPLLLCFLRYFYHFSCPGLLQLSVWVFLSLVLSLPSPACLPAVKQIQIAKKQMTFRQKEPFQNEIPSDFFMFPLEFQNFSCRGIKTNSKQFAELSMTVWKAVIHLTSTSNKNFELCPSLLLTVKFLTFGCFFFSLPGK